MERTGTIYHIFNTKTGKCYIGQTWRSLAERWGQHQETSSGCIKLRNSIQKYGISSFIISTLTLNLKTQEDMNKAEIYWIKYFDSVSNGYNLTHGGTYSKVSEETKRKLSKIRLGSGNPMFNKRHSEETKNKISNANSGEKCHWFGKTGKNHPLFGRTGEKSPMFGRTGEKNPLFGKHLSEELCDKLSKLGRGRAARPFRCFKDRSSCNDKVYNNIVEAAQELGLNQCCISDVLHGRQKTTRGYTFKYV